MSLLKVFVTGWLVLIGAMIFNFVATKLGLISWYELLQNKPNLKPQDIIWLFILYPLLLGLMVFVSLKVIRL